MREFYKGPVPRDPSEVKRFAAKQAVQKAGASQTVVEVVQTIAASPGHTFSLEDWRAMVSGTTWNATRKNKPKKNGSFVPSPV